MAHISIIWDQPSVRVWKTKGSNAQFLKEFSADDVLSLLAKLDVEAAALKITHLRLFVDLPDLNHHIERVPRIAKRLRKQLLEQRKTNMYGDEARTLASKEIDFRNQNTQIYYLISSLPENVSSAITKWAQVNGVHLEGIYSLPHSIAYLGAVQEESSTPFIQQQAIGNACYLIARNGVGEALFFSRIDTAMPSAEKIQAVARRLILFVEQEFSLTPTLQNSDIVEPNDTALVVNLSQQKKQGQLNLVREEEKRRQVLQLLRHRAFAFLSISLIFVIYYTLPLIEKKKTLELGLTELDPAIQLERRELNQSVRALEVKSSYINVIEFSEGRETIEEDAPVPSPLLVMLRALSNSLPELVEIDSYEGEIDTARKKAVFTMIGRPLTADIDLQAEVNGMYDGLQRRGWNIDEPRLSFEEKNRYSRLAGKRGQSRKFTLSFMLSTKNGDL